jgi:hypothetical protein
MPTESPATNPHAAAHDCQNLASRSTVLTRNVGASLSNSDCISAQVEIELRVGSSTTERPLPASFMPRATSVPSDVKLIVLAIAMLLLIHGSINRSRWASAGNDPITCWTDLFRSGDQLTRMSTAVSR